MRTSRWARLLAGAVLIGIPVGVIAADTLKIAFIDPLSGPFANVGEMEVRAYQYAIDLVNARGGVLGGTKLELVTFDNKANPQDALLALKQASDQGIRYITQGNSSAVALALSDAVSKQNARDPDRTILYLELRGGRPGSDERAVQLLAFPLRCRRGHEDVRADRHDRREQEHQEGLPHQSGLQLRPGRRQSGACDARPERPDISIVGDDLHPLGKVKDFSPYVAKIRASGADSVITGNWGNDFTLLVKAARESGLNARLLLLLRRLPGNAHGSGRRRPRSYQECARLRGEPTQRAQRQVRRRISREVQGGLYPIPARRRHRDARAGDRAGALRGSREGGASARGHDATST